MTYDEAYARLLELEVETRGRMMTEEEDAEFVMLRDRLTVGEAMREAMDLSTWKETKTITGRDS